MYLANVRVRNFRNLKDVAVDFAKGLNVIVGENNVGKTNLLDAVRIAVGPASSGESVRLTKEDRHRSPDGTIPSNTIQIDLAFQDLVEHEAAEFLEALNMSPTGLSRTSASIHYEWTWSESSKRWSQRRWGGDRPNAEAHIPDELLQSVPLTYLSALRDALAALSPGRQSRLGQLLQLSSGGDDALELEKIVEDANSKLEGQALIQRVEAKIGEALRLASGKYAVQNPAVRASEPRFDKIVNNLRLVLKEMGAGQVTTISELRANGLGMNNLIYIATVLAELDAAKDAALPLLFVEEPEAHLHPQLQVLLSDFLARGRSAAAGEASAVQTIVTTHSPTVAAHVSPSVIRVLHRTEAANGRCISISSCGLDSSESRKLRRMLDVTRAAMLFARGIVFVEGITEALLLPVIARRLARPLSLEDYGVSVIPMSGVSFSTFAKLFGKEKIQVPVAIVTDGDPGINYESGGKDPESAWPRKTGHSFVPCQRVLALADVFRNHECIRVFHSAVTLEYDLALAGAENADELFCAWKACYTGTPRSLTDEQFQALPDIEQKARRLWQVICLSQVVHGKAEVAQSLAERLEERDKEGRLVVPRFQVPGYLESAIQHVLPPAPGNTSGGIAGG